MVRSRPILYLARGASAGRERMALPLSTQARVGRRIALTVWWTMLLIVGVTIGLLVLVPGIQDSIQRASGAVAGGAFALSVAVALIMLGLWGISANNRNLKHAVDLIAQVDRARKETIQLEVVLTVIFGFGFYLDKFLRFWSAQTTVATVRNQFLTSALYQKELLIMKYSQVPQMEGLLHLVEALPDSPAKAQLVEHFRDSLRKLRQTIESKEWQVAPEERTY